MEKKKKKERLHCELPDIVETPLASIRVPYHGRWMKIQRPYTGGWLLGVRARAKRTVRASARLALRKLLSPLSAAAAWGTRACDAMFAPAKVEDVDVSPALTPVTALLYLGCVEVAE